MADVRPDASLEVRLGERRMAADELAHLNRMTTVGAVLPNVAHEINNALQVVSGLAEMVSARPGLAPDVVEKLNRMGAQANRATGMLRELVAFSRRDNAGVRLVDVRKLVDAALAMRRYHLSRDRVTVTVDAPVESPCLCRADPQYLQQVLVNLVLNAEQALRGRESPAIRVAVTQDGPNVVVVVEDNGPGLPRAAAGRAGEPFFTTRPEQAVGLGLAVAQALARLHGGSLEVASREEGGARVCLTLPAHAA